MTEPKAQFVKAALIFAGAGSGGLLRYWIGTLLQRWSGSQFPIGTLVVNASGCLMMGFLATLWSGTTSIREEYRAAVLIGVLGGYTTLSAFGWETLVLARSGDALRTGAYALGTFALGLAAVWAGAVVAGRYFTHVGT